jgi:hypothetical protein
VPYLNQIFALQILQYSTGIPMEGAEFSRTHSSHPTTPASLLYVGMRGLRTYLATNFSNNERQKLLNEGEHNIATNYSNTRMNV